MLEWLKRLLDSQESKSETSRSYYDNPPGFQPTLHSSDIMRKLKSDYNIDIVSVQRLHIIMGKMGILEKTSNGWFLTEYGRIKYTGWRSRIYNPTDGWHQDIVKDIADYIKTNGIDTNQINRKW